MSDPIKHTGQDETNESSTSQLKNTDDSLLENISRREMLYTTGSVAVFPGLLEAANAAQSQDPSSTSNPPASPGRIENLDQYIKNPRLFEENQVPTHPPSVPYQVKTTALNAYNEFIEPEQRWSESQFFKLLNGEWQLAWFEKPADVPDNYENTNWDTIPVPASLETEGYGENVSANTELTWDAIPEAESATPPEVPDNYNPVGVYRRSFSVPQNWDDRKTFLHFEGAKSAFFVWVNGEYVGFHKGSMTPAEFDVTNLILSGESHQVTVQVYRFSDGEALETWDQFRFSGIFRSCYLYSTPQVHLRDYFVRTNLDDNYENATLNVDAEVKNFTDVDKDPYKLTVDLYNQDGNKVTEAQSRISIEADGNTHVKLSKNVSNPEKWSAEHPNLYRLVFHLGPEGSGGEDSEVVVESVGFQEYEIQDNLFHVNGEPVDIKGVNWSEFSADTGRYVPFETQIKDAELMKQSNTNAIRLSHYPHDPSIYVLANEYGLYVNDEVNVETHWNTDLLANTEYYDAQVLERFRRMIQRDRNYPSIFSWGTGNEAGIADVHYEMVDYADKVGGNRFILHQSNRRSVGSGFGGFADFSDFIGIRYPLPEDLRTIVQNEEMERPVVMGEYDHALGNGLGLSHDLWELIQPESSTGKYDQLQGGFVWDWVNQAVSLEQVVNGEEITYRYYGRAKALDGVIFSDREVQPELSQLEKDQQPVAIQPDDLSAGSVTVRNHFNFTNLRSLDTTWELRVDGELVQEGTLDLALTPNETTTVTVPFEKPKLTPDAEYWLTLNFRLVEDTEYATAGHSVASEQFKVPFEVPSPEETDLNEQPSLSVREQDSQVILTGDEFQYSFDRNLGTFSSLQWNGTEILDQNQGPLLNAWHAPIDNELARGQASNWYEAGLDDLTHFISGVSVGKMSDTVVKIEVEATATEDHSAEFDTHYQYFVIGTGDIVIRTSANPNDKLKNTLENYLPRIGLQMGVRKQFSRFEWYGRGPEETYPDQKWGTNVGIYSGSVEEQYIPYPQPQTNGNKSDVRWASLSNDNGTGLAAFGYPNMNVDLNQFANLAEADHEYELEEQDRVSFTLAHGVAPLGTKFHEPLDEYQDNVDVEPKNFTMGIRPYATEETSPEQLSKRSLPFTAEGSLTIEGPLDFKPGESVTVITTFTNEGGREINNVKLSLRTPNGLMTEANSTTSFSTIESTNSVQTEWTVALSEDGQAGTDYSLTAEATYQDSGMEFSEATLRDVSVTEPESD